MEKKNKIILAILIIVTLSITLLYYQHEQELKDNGYGEFGKYSSASSDVIDAVDEEMPDSNDSEKILDDIDIKSQQGEDDE